MTEILLTGTLNLNSINQSKAFFEKSELNFLYNFHREHIKLRLKYLKKKLSPKFNLKNIKI